MFGLVTAKLCLPPSSKFIIFESNHDMDHVSTTKSLSSHKCLDTAES